MSTLQRHPGLRWLVPVTALGLVVGAPLLQGRATATPGLEPRTAEQLLTDLATVKPMALSGTVSQTSELGLPTMPALGGAVTTGSPLAVVQGKHTWRVWTNATDSTRIALIGSGDEVSLISNPTQTWLWNSATREAVKFGPRPTPEQTTPEVGPSSTLPTLSPDEAAKQVLAAIEPSTRVTTASATTVAGRQAYQLVMAPKPETTKVARVILAIDAQTKIPLRIQVIARGATKPAIDIGFTQLNLATPSSDVFTFTAPKDATVLTAEEYQGRHKSTGPQTTPTTTPTTTPQATGKKNKPGTRQSAPVVSGTGWTRVVVISGAAPTSADPMAEQVLSQLPRVSGDWGTGRLWNGTLVSAVITDDGRVAMGPVDPALLYAALR